MCCFLNQKLYFRISKSKLFFLLALLVKKPLIRTCVETYIYISHLEIYMCHYIKLIYEDTFQY